MKSPYIQKIFLVWRPDKHKQRILIGEINYYKGTYTFKYDQQRVIEASNDGFINYPDFPLINKVYTENVLTIFSQRLHDLNRTDTDRYFDFWEIDKRFAQDKFYLLAQTQGLLSTDNFEFLALYYLKKGLTFISEIAGIYKNRITSDFLHIGDKLSWEYEKDNMFDRDAILIKKGKTKLGYIKRVHNQVFKNKRAQNLTITVKDIEKNDKITRVFISIKNIE